jgi:hypothetical protein
VKISVLVFLRVQRISKSIVSILNLSVFSA